MPGLIIWKDRQMDRMRRDLDRLFDRLCDDFCVPLPPERVRKMPFIELSETEDKVIVRAEIPGLDPGDLDITIVDDTLNIKGTLKQERRQDNEGVHTIERHYGTFSRRLQLPCKIMIDDVEAVYREGVLRIVMPKCEQETLPSVKITVT